MRPGLGVCDAVRMIPRQSAVAAMRFARPVMRGLDTRPGDLGRVIFVAQVVVLCPVEPMTTC